MAKYTSEERETLAAAEQRLGLSLPRIESKRPGKGAKLTDAERTEQSANRRGFQQLRRIENPTRPGLIRSVQEIKKAKHPIKALNGKNGQALWQKRLHEWSKVGPVGLKNWRLYHMNMTQAECAGLVRVTPNEISQWENGEKPIPFLMWYMVHCTLQWDEVRLSRAGFADFYIEYQNGNAYLCSSEYPDIRFTPADLAYFKRAMIYLDSIERNNKDLQGQVDRLTFENTELRRMFKQNEVTSQVEAMQEQIKTLMKRLNTADVIPFQAQQETMATNLQHKAA